MIVTTDATALVLRSLPHVASDTDTGRRLFRGQMGGSVGRSFDEKWLYITAPAGVGWASARYLSEAKPAIKNGPAALTPAWPTVPNGLAEIISTFGEAGSAQCSAGRVILPQSLPYSWQEGTVSLFACHKLLEDVFSNVFYLVHQKGLWDLLEDYGGCYQPRPIKASTRLSTHAWGISIDLNANSNALGVKPTISGRIVALMEDHGFVWGGRWNRPDGMHFQYCKGY